MLKFISEILLSFSSCFSRTAAFEYFVILVTGFMVRSAGASFTSAELPMYGGNKEARYQSWIYLWGQKLYQPLRFVLVEYEAKQVILVSTDLTMSAEDIIIAYACRFKIETMFREFKQQFGGLFYHFWTKAVPKLDRYRRKNSPDPLSLVKDTGERARIIRTLKATEGYVLLASIAMGIIQMLCLNYGDKLSVSSFRYLRTSSQQVMAEASMIKYLGRNLFRFMAQQDGLTITKIIFSRQIPAKQEDFDRLVS